MVYTIPSNIAMDQWYSDTLQTPTIHQNDTQGIVEINKQFDKTWKGIRKIRYLLTVL